jgi:Leucine-rich repeat (LRR) protein
MNRLECLTVVSVCLLATATAGAQPVPVVINEIAAATDEDFHTPSYDAIELYNPGDTPADVSYWKLTDDLDDDRVYRIPEGTTIPPGGYLVLLQDVDTTLPLDTFPHEMMSDAFGLKSVGEDLFLLSANAEGELTGYIHGGSFPGAENGVTLGRQVDSLGIEHFVPQSSNTLGFPNAGPVAATVVISELLIDPASGSQDEEFIEIANLTDYTIVLSNPAQPELAWHCSYRLLPPFTCIAPRGTAILIEDSATALRSRRAIPAEVPIIPMEFLFPSLNNNDESVQLGRPVWRHDLEVVGENPIGRIYWNYAEVDEVSYRTSPPWPLGTRDLGLSLEKQQLDGLGSDPANWSASSMFGGTPGRLPNSPSIANIQDANLAASLRIALGLAAGADIPISALRNLNRFEADAAGIRDLSWLEYATALQTVSLRDNEILQPHALLSLPNLISVDLSENRITTQNQPVLDALASRGVTVTAVNQKGADRIVAFPSPGLEQAVRDAIGLDESDAITALDLLQIKELFVIPSHRVHDISGLENLENLERLSITGYYDDDDLLATFADLAPVANLTKLKYLDIAYNDVSDLSPLAGLTALEHLNLHFNPITDLSPLENLTNLTYLNLGRNYDLASIDSIKNLRQLRYLAIKPSGVDLSPLSGLTNLVALKILDQPIQSFPLTIAPKLEFLSGAILDPDQLAFLDSMPELRILHVRVSRSLVDVTPITTRPELRVLGLHGADEADLSPVFSMPWLNTLTLSSNRLTDIGGLSDQLDPAQHSLHMLNLDWNYLDIRPGTATRRMIDELATMGTRIEFNYQRPRSHPDAEIPDLIIANGSHASPIVVSWYDSPMGLETSTDLINWQPYTGLVTQEFGTYFKMESEVNDDALLFRLRR